MFTKKTILFIIFILVLVTSCDHFTKKNDFREIANKNITYQKDITYHENVKHIFDNRCVACHSCLESPCQLNLQSYDGILRGGSHDIVYGSLRLTHIKPTRMFEDEQSLAGWRKQGFHDVIGKFDNKSNQQESILLDYIADGENKRERPDHPVQESQVCYDNRSGSELIKTDASSLSMPYGLPSLKENESLLLMSWLKEGFPYSVNPNLQEENKLPETKDLTLIHSWENFLNYHELKYRITARYLYEHLYLAHLYFDKTKDKSNQPTFYKLVRSKNTCSAGVDTISSRTPNSDPLVKQWYYCFVKEISTVANKNHMPYRIDEKKLAWIKKLFIESDWTPTQFPSFEKKVAANPFIAFKEIPTKVKYKFLLEDSYYHISTFIKGPVCNGNSALNSIQEQFFTFFIDPDSDLMVKDENYRHLIENEVILPGVFEDDESITTLYSNYSSIANGREAHEEAHKALLEKNFPAGYALENIWDGDGVNQNAALTILRHSDNSKVAMGAVGDISKTVFVVDYAILEKLVYNLVVNFDIFAGIKHRYLTRLYMDFLRMESENTFLQFLPQNQRLPLKRSWYKGNFFTQEKMKNSAEYVFPKNEVQINFESNNPKLEFVQKVLFKRLKNITAKNQDRINWKQLASLEVANEEEKQLKKLAAVQEHFVRYLPDLAFLFIKNNNQITSIYNIVHNKEHTNIAWFFSESSRLVPEEDTLIISKNFLGAYPNRFFLVEDSELTHFVNDLKQIQSLQEYSEFLQKYGIDRMNPQMWSLYDKANEELKRQDPIEAGKFDLSRYDL